MKHQKRRALRPPHHRGNARAFNHIIITEDYRQVRFRGEVCSDIVLRPVLVIRLSICQILDSFIAIQSIIFLMKCLSAAFSSEKSADSALAPHSLLSKFSAVKASPATSASSMATPAQDASAHNVQSMATPAQDASTRNVQANLMKIQERNAHVSAPVTRESTLVEQAQQHREEFVSAIRTLSSKTSF